MNKHNIPLVSVVIPIYNTADYLQRCVDSALAQSYNNLEIILVDDCSTDSSGKICQDYEKDNKNIRYIKKTHNEGLAYARRDGVLAAQGEYIGFLDSDDWIEPCMYKEMMRYVIDYGSEIVSCGAISERADGTLFELNDPIEPGVYDGDRLKWLLDNLIYLKKAHSGAVTVSLPLKVYKKSLLVPAFESIPPHMTYWEDLAYAFPPYFNTKKVAVTGECYYHIAFRENSMSRENDENKLKNMVNSITIAQKIYDEYGGDIQKCFGQKALRIVTEYLWSIALLYSDKSIILQKWAEVNECKQVAGLYSEYSMYNDDYLLSMIMRGRLSSAFIYAKMINFEKKIENRVKNLINYEKKKI